MFFYLYAKIFISFFCSPEDVEKLKEQDIFEQLLQEMIVEFPHMANVLVAERDMYISGFLQRIIKTPVFLPGRGMKRVLFSLKHF